VGAGATSIPLVAGTLASVIPAGDTFSLPAFTAQAAANVTLVGGSGSISTREVLPSAIANGAAITVRRCPDYNDTALGSPVVLRLQSDWGPAVLNSAAYETSGVWSPPIRMRLLSGSSMSVAYAAALTFWGVAASQTNRVGISLWDADLGTLLAQSGGGSNTSCPYDVNLAQVTHTTLGSFINVTRTTRIRIALFFGGGRPGDNINGFTFLRWVSLGVGTTAPQVSEAGSMPLFHRAQDLLAQHAASERFRVKLAAVAAFAGDADELLTIGATVRLYHEPWGLDRRVRVQALTWNPRDPNDMTIELAAPTPRLSRDAFGG
jgi:hypothetical protein